MTEGSLTARCCDFFEAESAGLEKGSGVNLLAAAVMKEAGIDIAEKEPQIVFDRWNSGGVCAYVVTVCSESEAGGCPIFPGPTKRLRWPFRDPSKFTGAWDEKLTQTREVWDEIAARIEELGARECCTSAESYLDKAAAFSKRRRRDRD